jgi:hypothetical protein
MNEILVLKVEPHKRPYPKIIKDDLPSLQKEVGGYIEIIYPFDDDAVVICNEEGKLIGLEGNRKIGGDIIAGDFLIARDDGQGGLTKLTVEQIQKYTKMFESDETYSGEIEDAIYCEVHPIDYDDSDYV